MKELALKYGCNPNQKPARIFMTEGELPIEVPVSYTHLDVYKRQHASRCRSRISRTWCISRTTRTSLSLRCV